MNGMMKVEGSSEPSENSESAIPHSSNDQLPETKLTEETHQLSRFRLLKPSPRNHDSSELEWSFYPSSGNRTYHSGKKCIFNGVHLRTRTSSSEWTLEMCIGKKKYVTEIDSRNGIPFVTPGDHPYEYPEQSTDFHKLGSIRPPVNFGSSTTYKRKSDTFIPLQRLPLIPCVPFHIKEKQQELEKERMEVKNLDHWKPAHALLQSLVPGGVRRLTLPQL